MFRTKECKRQSDYFNVCSMCKTSYSCCHETTPPVSSERRQIIQDYLRAGGMSIKEPFEETDYVFPRIAADGYCIFHDRKTRKCLIHQVKPETCVAGPITFDINVKTGKIEYFVKMESICQLAGVVYKDKKLLQEHLESATKEIFRLVKELDSKALRAILRKDEPETFKIDEEKAGKGTLKKLTDKNGGPAGI